MPSQLEEIEREATLVSERAVCVGPTTAEGLLAEWERLNAEEARRIKESRAAFERGEIAEEDVYRGDFFTLTGRVRIKMLSSFRGRAVEHARVVTVDALRASPPQAASFIIERSVIPELRRSVKQSVIKTLCEESGLDPATFNDRLYEERLAEGQKLTLRDFLTTDTTGGARLPTK